MRTVHPMTRAAWGVQPLYIVAEVLIGLAFGMSYSFRDDTISALGTTCLSGASGCSNAGWVMNTAFIAFGALQALGARPLLRSRAGRAWQVVGALWATAGVFSVLVGIFPVDTHPVAHTAMALPVFVCQPVALMLHVSLCARPAVRPAGAVLALVCLIGTLAFGLLLGAPDGAGLAERAAIWPIKIWLALCLLRPPPTTR